MEELLEFFGSKKRVLSELNNYCEFEYGHEHYEDGAFFQEILQGDLRIPIAETSWVELEDFTVEVYFDVSYLALRKNLHGTNGLTYTESKWYNNIEVAIENIKGYDFDSLTVFDKGTGWLIEKLS